MAAAVGYRFHPTDEELIAHYLKLKMNGHDSLVGKVIPEVDVYRLEPSDLPNYSVAASSSDDQVWYFYCRLDYKYKNSKRANRATERGFWKVTGKPRFIVARETGEQIGVKKTLVFFYRTSGGGDAKPVSTDWVIHQYQATTLLPDQTEYVICKLKNKGDSWTKNSATTSGEPSHCTSASDADNHGAAIQVGDSDTVVRNSRSIQPVLYIEGGLTLDDFLQGDDDLFFNEPNNKASTLLRLDSDEEEEVDPDSYLLIPDDYLSNETAYAHPNDYRPEKALSTYHAEDDVKEVNVITSEVPESYQLFAGIPQVKSTSKAQHQGFSMVSKDKAEEGTTKPLTGAKKEIQWEGAGGMEIPLLFPKSERAERPIRVMNLRSAMKLRSEARATGKGWKVGSMIQMVEVPERQMQSPPTVYMVNILVALLALAFFIYELPFLR